jgi:hypothetical protein
LHAKTTFNYLVSRPVLWQVSWWDPPKTLKNFHINTDLVAKHGNATDVANKLSQSTRRWTCLEHAPHINSGSSHSCQFSLGINLVIFHQHMGGHKESNKKM